MRIQFLVPALVISVFSFNTAAAPCEENFTSTGNFISGATYKTYAELPTVPSTTAYEGALADITKTASWKILQQDKAQGAIQAVQADSYKKGKSIPLNISVEASGSGSKVTMSYVTPAGTLSPESAIKNQFCQTIQAAANQHEHPSSNAVVNNSASKSAASYKSSAMQGIASITADQQAKISKALNKKVEQQMQDKITESNKTIQPFLEMRSCLNGSGVEGRSAQNIYAAPGVNFYVTDKPMDHTKYHNKEQCLTIAKIQGWKSPALNALQFEVLYLADDSGETYKENHELVKQPDGEWLFTR